MSAVEPPPSFSTVRKWSISLNVVVASAAVLALVLMINYLAARHFGRVSLSAREQITLSPRTLKVLASLTNEIKVTVYFDKEQTLFKPVWALLKEYRYRNSKITVEMVDYKTDPGLASVKKAKYNLNKVTDKDLVIFDSGGLPKVVPATELADRNYDIQAMMSGQTQPPRLYFKGEAMFTAAIMGVTSAGPLKAFLLQGHGECDPKDNSSDGGYGRFVDLLKQNNIFPAQLELKGTNDVPPGSLLIIAGSRELLSFAELDKIDRYLKNGGRMLVLFNLFSLDRSTGLERILAEWGVDVGRNIVRDPDNAAFRGELDIASSTFGLHPITSPLLQDRIDFLQPRSIRKSRGGQAGADAASVTELVFTGPEAQAINVTSRGGLDQRGSEGRTNVCLAVAVEKGKIKNVRADLGTTRMIVLGDSHLWDNQLIDYLANRDFASLAVNWLMDRTEALAIEHQPLKDYKLTMTKSQFLTVSWLMLGAVPAGVLLVGLLVWLRRRG